MEYYIMKLYQKAKEKNKKVEQGFDRYSKNTKRRIILLLICVIISYIGMIITIACLDLMRALISMCVCVCALIIATKIRDRDEKVNLEKYADSYEEKLTILDDLLVKKYDIASKEKLEILLKKYQDIIDKKEVEENKRNKVIIALFSTFAGAASISFTNLDKMGIGFGNWLIGAIFLLVIVSGAALLIYADTFFDSFKKKYEKMIKDLKDLMFIKYECQKMKDCKNKWNVNVNSRK